MSIVNEIECVRMKELAKLLGVHKSTIYRWIEAGEFPRGVQLGERSVVYLLKDIKSWQEAKLATQNSYSSSRPTLASSVAVS